MNDPVRDCYDANAELYASLFLDDLEHDARSIAALASFARVAAQQQGPVADLGCGPGHVVDHLCRLGVTTIGSDVSPGQVAQARKAFPDRQFHVGDFTALDAADSSLGGIVSRYSIIHLLPATLPNVFDRWFQALEPSAPLFVSFFGSRSPESHGTPFDHKVVTAYELFPDTVGRLLHDAGFTEVGVDATTTPQSARPFDDAIVVARKHAAVFDSTEDPSRP